MLNSVRSQRDWIRTPSRGWIKHLEDIRNQHKTLQLHFVKAHTNKNDSLSNGNDKADKLAKLGAQKTAKSYTTLDYDGVYLSLHGKVLMSGIKKDIQKVMKVTRKKAWTKLSRQGYVLR